MRFGEKTIRQRACMICAETRPRRARLVCNVPCNARGRRIDTEMDVGRAGPLSQSISIHRHEQVDALASHRAFRGFGGHGGAPKSLCGRGPRVKLKTSHYFLKRRGRCERADFLLEKTDDYRLSTFAVISKTPSRIPASRSLPVDFPRFLDLHKLSLPPRLEP